ncbi:hypothetical protein [Saccharothrix sp. NRRL B-16314]|uniref:hypothetical protein n=1 Tax=Saccharothrix sp. NRRL B-16314 TaxID=1463825 RepID=UPI000A3EBD32|nr:hypothetical protein [Saccharothrix sp. NRRL B-16314]
MQPAGLVVDGRFWYPRFRRVPFLVPARVLLAWPEFRVAVDWDGLTCSPGTPSACDLSATVLTDLGRFPSRDDLFADHGQTLCGPLTTLADPFLSRWAPPAVTGR